MILATMLQHDQFHLHNWNYINYAGSHSTHVSRLHVSFYFQSISFFFYRLFILQQYVSFTKFGEKIILKLQPGLTR